MHPYPLYWLFDLSCFIIDTLLDYVIRFKIILSIRLGYVYLPIVVNSQIWTRYFCEWYCYVSHYESLPSLCWFLPRNIHMSRSEGLERHYFVNLCIYSGHPIVRMHIYYRRHTKIVFLETSIPLFSFMFFTSSIPTFSFI